MDNSTYAAKKAEELEAAYLKLFDVHKDPVQHVKQLLHSGFEKFSVYQPTKVTYSAGAR